MRKLISFWLTFLIFFTLTGCNNELKEIVNITKEPVKVELTKYNFADYIIIDTNYNNFSVDTIPDPFINIYKHRGIADLIVKARLKKDVQVENIIIEGKVSPTGFGWASKIYPFKLVLDKNGEADTTNQIFTDYIPLVLPEMPEISKFFDYELIDNEFFINDETVVITSITGSVFEEQ